MPKVERRARGGKVTAPAASRCPAAIVVMGVAGAGKTTVGRALAAALGRAFHDADDFHPPANVERMRRGIPLTDADRAPWLAALRELIAASRARGEAMVLACSALRAAYRVALVPPGAPADAVHFVHLEVPPALAERRLAERPGHFMPPSLVTSQFATLEPPDDALRVDAAREVEKLVREIRGALGC